MEEQNRKPAPKSVKEGEQKHKKLGVGHSPKQKVIAWKVQETDSRVCWFGACVFGQRGMDSG
jgi:hypothetical protein